MFAKHVARFMICVVHFIVIHFLNFCIFFAIIPNDPFSLETSMKRRLHMKRTLKLLAVLLVILMAVETGLTPAAAAERSDFKSVKVSTSKKLAKYLKDDSVGTITLSSKKAITVKIADAADAWSKKLIINAAKATVINSAKLEGITIKSALKYTEKASGNSIVVSAADTEIVIYKGAKVADLTASGKSLKLTVQKSAKVDLLKCDSKDAVITIDAASKAKVNVDAVKGASVTVEGSGKKNVKINENKDTGTTTPTPTPEATPTPEPTPIAETTPTPTPVEKKDKTEIKYASLPAYGTNRNNKEKNNALHVNYPEIAVSAPVDDTMIVRLNPGGSVYVNVQDGVIGIPGTMVKGYAYKKTEYEWGDLQYSVVGFIPEGLEPGWHTIDMVFTPIKSESWGFRIKDKKKPFTVPDCKVLILSEADYDSIYASPDINYVGEDGSFTVNPITFTSVPGVDIHAEFAYYDNKVGNKSPKELGLIFSESNSFKASKEGEKLLAVRVICEGRTVYELNITHTITFGTDNVTQHVRDGQIILHGTVASLGSHRAVSFISITPLPTASGTYTMDVEFRVQGVYYDSELGKTQDEVLPYTVTKTVTFIVE